MSDHYEMKIGDLKEEIVQLERELEQQRFNNKHNMSIDQIIADEMTDLKVTNKNQQKQIALLEETLTTYAYPPPFDGDRAYIHGYVARQVLVKIDKMRK